MILGILKESGTETRVAMLPEILPGLTEQKVEILVEKSAGAKAFAPDEAYVEYGAKVVSREEIFAKADLLLQIQPPSEEDVKKLKESQVWISAFNPLWETGLVKTFLQQGLTSFSLDSVPGQHVHRQWIFFHQWLRLQATKLCWKLH